MNAMDSDAPKQDSKPSSRPGSVGGQSVLVEIERLIGTKFRVKLKDLAEEKGPDVAVGEVDLPIRDIGRYQSIGEIARGGVGIVVRCRDMDLGRDIAMKVIRDEHAGNQVTLQRFVEEAQVGGQLQHPGVVPVYELGLREDGRPYFTMKLIKGKTLSALLTDRKEPTDDLRKFLRIFEQICHTLAFAHARGVVHRDLKPANILVGSFGEVQVSDWGFAKVLSGGGVADERRALESQISVIETVRTMGSGSESMAGSVMGTPAYMSPEQALGDVDRLDERSDVFSLGALLVEILTGSPPYTGRTAEEVLMKAARHELGSAEERLRESGADRRLVDLALLCLKKERKKRPRNAKILAKAITAYLASVEKRLRNAQIVAAKALVQAQGERKARRLMTVLSAAVLLVAALGGGGFLWMNGKRIAAIEQHSREVGRVFEDAGRIASKARHSGDLKRWAEAEETAAYARTLAGDGDIDEERILRIDDLHAAIAAEASAARQIAERRKTNLQLLAELEKIRSGGTDATGHAGTDAAYDAAFVLAGLDVDKLDAAEIIAKVRENDLANELAPVFDSWAVSRRQASPDARGEWMKLVAVAREVDPNDWRNRFREAWSSGQSDRIAALAADARPADLDAYSLCLLGNALGQLGEADRAIDVLGAAAEAHPDDFWVHAWLGYWQCRERHWKDAICHYTAALSIQPESAGTWNNLAWALGETGQATAELAALERAIGIDPTFARALYNEGIARKEQGDPEGARSALEKAVAANDQYALAWRALATVYMELEEYRRAEEAINRAIDMKAGSKAERVETLKRAARLCLKRQDYRGARRWLDAATTIDREDAEALTLLGDTWWMMATSKKEWDEAEYSWMAAIRVDPDFDYARRKLISAYDERDSLPKHLAKWQADVDEDPNDWQAWFNLGLGREKDEDWAGAIEAFHHAVRLHGDSGWTHYALANVLRHVHAYTEATEHYERAAELITTDAGVLNDLGATWERRGRPDRALRVYRLALHRNPGEVMSLFNLGNALIKYGHTQSGLNELKKALEADPTHAAALSRYVGTLCWRRQEGDVGEATRAAEEALRCDKEFEGGAYRLGTALGYRKSIDVAKAKQKKFLKDAEEKTLAGYWNNFGVARFRCGDAETAVTAWRISRDTSTTKNIALRNLPLGLRALGDPEAALEECVDQLKKYPESEYAQEAMAQTLAATGDPDAAVEAWEEVFSRNSESVLARNSLVSALYRRGGEADFEKAVGITLEAARTLPANPILQSSLGRCLGWIGDGDRALALHAEEFPDATVSNEAVFRRGFATGLFDRRRLEESLEFAVEAAEMQPDNVQHHWSVAFPICWRLPYAEAVAKYDELFPERSKAHEAWFYAALSSCYAGLQDPEAALTANQEFRKRLPIRSTMLPGALYRESVILRSLHRHEEAHARVKEMARLIPGNFWPDRAMAELLIDLGRYRDAASLLLSATESFQGTPLPNYWLGLMMLRLGDFEAAADQLRKARLMTGYIERGGWWVAQADRMVELSPRRAAILTGTARVESAQDAIDFARFCTYSGYPLQAAAWYDRAFGKDPALLEDLDEDHRVNAAQVALLAAAGKGAIAETLGTEQRAVWRARALAWMKDELAAWETKLEDDYYGFAAEAIRGIHGRSFPSGWHIGHSFAIVSKPELAAKLPPEEKAEWDAIFAGAKDLIRRFNLLERRE